MTTYFYIDKLITFRVFYLMFSSFVDDIKNHLVQHWL
jgi:hypothetical protein